VRIDASQVSLINRRTMRLASPPVSQEPRSNVMTLSKLLFFSKKLLKSLSVRESETRKSSLLFSTLMSPLSDSGMRLSVLFYISAA
jgi:hypothetical protein